MTTPDIAEALHLADQLNWWTNNTSGHPDDVMTSSATMLRALADRCVEQDAELERLRAQVAQGTGLDALRDMLRAEVDRLTAAPAAGNVATPAGWKLVPEAAGIGMLQAALNASRQIRDNEAPLPRNREMWAAEIVWEAMLAASPAAPAQQITTAPAGSDRPAETGGSQSRAVVPSLTVGGDRLTVASIAMAANVEALRLMQAIEQAGEGNVTLNQKLTMDQALQAIAALSPAAQAEPVAAWQLIGADSPEQYAEFVKWVADGKPQPPAQAEPVAPMRSRPVRFEARDGGRWIDDDDFDHDAVLKIDGDFGSDEARAKYAAMVCERLNAGEAQPAAQELDAWKCVNCCGAGWTWQLRQVAERDTDVQTVKIHCDECGGTGWCGPDAAMAAAKEQQ